MFFHSIVVLLFLNKILASGPRNSPAKNAPQNYEVAPQIK